VSFSELGLPPPGLWYGSRRRGGLVECTALRGCVLRVSVRRWLNGPPDPAIAAP
jgi:hypothetical protein